MAEPIWINEPTILFSSTTWQKFVPTKDMDVPTSLNAVVRFTIYFSVILFLATGVQTYLLAIPIVLATTAVFSKVFPTTRALVETFGGKIDEKNKSYTMPTKENPFMNPLLTEIIDNPNRPDAANVAKTDVKREIEKSFQQTSDIYMDTSDRFDLAQSMRTFSTLQSAMIPNDQDGFLKFLTKGLDTPNHSSAPNARNAKIASEGHIIAPGSVRSLPNSTSHPTGTHPSGPALVPSSSA
jgi:hypothetical protein